MDVASRAQSDRFGKRGDAGKGLSHSGSGYQVHGSIPTADPGQWNERHPATTTITEPECIRGAICSLDQVRMSESDDLHRAGVVTPCRGRIRGPLPRGAKSSRAGQSADPGGAELCTRSWDGPPEPKTRWDAQLLLSRNDVMSSARIFGQNGVRWFGRRAQEAPRSCPDTPVRSPA